MAAEGAGLGTPPQPPYPRISALRLDGTPWKYPLVPLKLGVFQELRDAILTGEPYQAHGWFISRQNPILSLPDRNKTLQAFGKMDFIATVDIIMNDTAWFSDVVLPEASYLERYDPLLPVGDKAFIRQPVIEPQGEAKSALWIYKQLGERLGLGDFFQYADEEDYLRQQLAPLGVSLEEVKAKGYAEMPAEEESDEIVFNTPSGKIEVYSETLEKAGFSPWPTWEEPPAPAEGEFYLLTGKVAQHTQFGTQNNQLLHKYSDEPRLWMNAKTAAETGLGRRRLGGNHQQGRQGPQPSACHRSHPPGLRLPDPRLRTSLQGADHRLRRWRQRLGPACHLHRSDQRRTGAQPDFCNGKEGLKVHHD